MKTTLFAAVMFSTVAFAQGAPPPAKAGAAPAAKEEPKKDAAAPAAGGDAAAMMASHGPWTRKVKDEKAVKKEVEEFFKKNEEAEK